MKGLFICLLGISLVITTPLNGQTLDLSKGNLKDQLAILKEATGWSFNYNPEIIGKVYKSFDQKLDLQNQSKAVHNLLNGTKIDFEIIDGVIVLIPPLKKDYHLSGFLKDERTGEPLPYAHVYIDKVHSSYSDDRGFFEIRKEAYKDERVHISYLGYQDTSLYASMFDREEMEIFLKTDAVVFSKEIIIRDYIFSAITQGKSFNGIDFDMRSLNYELGALEKDVLKSIQFLPGVTSLDESASNISIRGSEPEHNLVLWENAPMYSSGHLFGMISSINPFVIDKLSINNDVYSSSIDNRIGGVVEIQLPDEIKDNLEFGFGSTFTESHVEMITPLMKNKLGLIFSGRKSVNGVLPGNLTFDRYGEKLFESSQIDMQQIVEVSESELDVDYYDMNLKLIFEPIKNLNFTSAVFSSRDYFLHEYEFQSGQIEGYDSLNVSNTIFSNAFSYDWTDNARSVFRVNTSKYQSESIFLSSETQSAEEELYSSNKNEISDLQLKVIHAQQFSKMNWQAGYVYDRKKLEYEISEFGKYEDDNELEEEITGQFHHLFADVHWRHKNLLLDIGSRMTYFSEESTLDFSPRLTLSYLWNDDLSFRLSSGIFNQYINQVVEVSQSQLNLENKIWTLIPDDPMIAQKLSVGAVYSKNNWLLDLDIYSHRSSSVPVLSTGQSSTLNIEGSGSSSSRGLEFLLKKRWNNFSSGLSYHLGSVRYNIPQFDSEDFAANVDQRHNLSFVTHYKKNAWNFSLQYAFKSGLPYSDLNGIQLIQTMEEDYYEIELAGINDQRLPNFHRLDCTVGYRTTLWNDFKFDFQVSLFNVLDTKNSLSRNYLLSNTDETNDEPEVFEVEKFQLRRTPQCLIRISF